MEDSQRDAMYQGWKRTKIFLQPTNQVDDEKATVSVVYEGCLYSETFYKKDCIGSSNPYNIAYNLLLSKMQSINKNIEIPYDIY